MVPQDTPPGLVLLPASSGSFCPGCSRTDSSPGDGGPVEVGTQGALLHPPLGQQSGLAGSFSPAVATTTAPASLEVEACVCWSGCPRKPPHPRPLLGRQRRGGLPAELIVQR